MMCWNIAFGAILSAALPTPKTAMTITILSQPTPRRLHSPNALKVPKHRSRSFDSLNTSRRIIPASIVTLRRFVSPNGQWISFAVLDGRKIQFLIFWHLMRLTIGWIFFGVWQIVSAHRWVLSAMGMLRQSLPRARQTARCSCRIVVGEGR